MSTVSQDELCLFRREGAVGILTLNRPQAMNAVNAELSTAVGAALEEFAADPDLRVGIVTGAGRAFCAGADLKELAAGRSFLSPTHPEWGFAGLTQHFVDKPLIAAVNGAALGGGTEIVLACDLAILSDRAQLGLPEVTRGLIAGAGGALRLPDQVPAKVAAAALLTGDPIPAHTALAWGMVNAVVSPEDVLPEALRLARRIAANAPLAVTATKRLMTRRRDFGSDWNPWMWEMNDTEFGDVMASADVAEGLAAFIEKRAPRFSGR